MSQWILIMSNLSSLIWLTRFELRLHHLFPQLSKFRLSFCLALSSICNCSRSTSAFSIKMDWRHFRLRVHTVWFLNWWRLVASFPSILVLVLSDCCGSFTSPSSHAFLFHKDFLQVGHVVLDKQIVWVMLLASIHSLLVDWVKVLIQALINLVKHCHRLLWFHVFKLSPTILLLH